MLPLERSRTRRQVTARRKKPTATLRTLRGPQTPPLRSSADFEITGTWDFKWPLDTEIRVAFQKLPEASGISEFDFMAAKLAVWRYVQRWNPLPGGIRLTLLTEDLLPPMGSDNSLTDQHRSPFLPETPRMNDYEVLVSLANLPLVRIDPFRGLGHEVDTVRFPISELGSYARRADYGAPTMYLGRFGRYLGMELLQYLDSAIGQHVVVHEFGHALGLPHLHQHPELIVPASGTADADEVDKARLDFYRPSDEIIELTERLLGVEGIDDDIVSDHLLDVWRGNKDFSDWIPFTQEELARHRASGLLESVMTLPYYPCTLRGQESAAPCQADELDLTKVITQPKQIDRDMLSRMYDPKYTDRAGAALGSLAG